MDEDRILTAYAMIQNRSGEVESEWHWIIDPGVEVPAGAAEVHGMTTEWIREHGNKDAKSQIADIYSKIRIAVDAKIPVVGYNQVFDVSMLHCETIRHGATYGLLPLIEKGTWYDPLPHDKQRDKYRKGKRKLGIVCAAHGIEFKEEDAHAAQYDVQKTGELAWKLLAEEDARFEDLQILIPAWKEEQNESLERYFESQGTLKEDGSKIVIDRGWPIYNNVKEI